MKTSHFHTLEWSRKGRKRDNRALRAKDQAAAIAEAQADNCAICGGSESDPDGICECCDRCSLCAAPECLAFGKKA